MDAGALKMAAADLCHQSVCFLSVCCHRHWISKLLKNLDVDVFGLGFIQTDKWEGEVKVYSKNLQVWPCNFGGKIEVLKWRI